VVRKIQIKRLAVGILSEILRISAKMNYHCVDHLEQTAELFGTTSFSEKAVGLLHRIISNSSYKTNEISGENAQTP
jgi:hypothetical protein